MLYCTVPAFSWSTEGTDGVIQHQHPHRCVCMQGLLQADHTAGQRTRRGEDRQKLDNRVPDKGTPPRCCEPNTKARQCQPLTTRRKRNTDTTGSTTLSLLYIVAHTLQALILPSQYQRQKLLLPSPPPRDTATARTDEKQEARTRRRCQVYLTVSYNLAICSDLSIHRKLLYCHSVHILL